MKDFAKLPDPHALSNLMIGLARCDAIMSPEWEYRYFSYDPLWSPYQSMGSIRNGSGDDVFVVFQKEGAFLKGFSHEYQTEKPFSQLYEGVPPTFQEHIAEPAFTPEYVTFCLWHESTDKGWQSSTKAGSIELESLFLLECLDGKAETYQSFCEDYYEEEVFLSDIKSVLSGKAVDAEQVLRMNAEADPAFVLQEISNLGI